MTEGVEEPEVDAEGSVEVPWEAAVVVMVAVAVAVVVIVADVVVVVVVLVGSLHPNQPGCRLSISYTISEIGLDKSISFYFPLFFKVY